MIGAWAIVSSKVNGRPVIYSLHLDYEQALEVLQEMIEQGLEVRIVDVRVSFI